MVAPRPDIDTTSGLTGAFPGLNGHSASSQAPRSVPALNLDRASPERGRNRLSSRRRVASFGLRGGFGRHGRAAFRAGPDPCTHALADRIRRYDTFDEIEAELEAASIVAALRLESPVG